MEQYISKSALLAEIERLVNNYDKALDYEAALEDVRNYIDSLEVKEIQVKESAELQHDKETCKENGDSITQEPVSNVWHDMSEDAENGRNIIIIDPKDFYGAVLRKGGSQLKNHNKERYVKWAYIDDIINITNKEEPVIEEYGKAEKFIDEHTKYCSNLAHFEEPNGNVWEENTPWLNPDQARKAVEIAKEEVIEQMMAKAIDGVVTFDYYDAGDKTYGCVAHESFCLEDFGLKDMDKVKMIIIKQD